MRRILIALLTTLFAAALLVAPGLTPKAEATTASHHLVGTITGWYIPAPSRDYRGESWPQPNRCIVVQRLTGGGSWTRTGVNGASSCTPSIREPWSITNDAYVSDTYGIRMYVSVGISTGSRWNLCASKDACLRMRTGGG